MEERITQLENTVAHLVDVINRMGNSGAFPFDIQKAIETRLGGFRASASAKTAASATQAVNEGGVATYSVMKPPTGFIKVTTEDGVAVDVPYI